MLIEQRITENGIETVDKVGIAVARLREFEPPEGYYLAFSGGKDSVVIYDLAVKAGVRFDAHYSVTEVDPPELVKFIRQQYPEVERNRPEETMWSLIERKMPPTRIKRFCCEVLKERGGDGRRVVTGIRWAVAMTINLFLFIENFKIREAIFHAHAYVEVISILRRSVKAMGEKYLYEQDMIEPIISSATKFTESTGSWMVFLECASCSGIADIVFVEFNKNAIKERMDSGLGPVVKLVQIQTLLSLDVEKPKKINAISKEIGYSESYLRQVSIPFLIENGFIIKTNDGYFCSSKYLPVINRIVALEVKRENWARGFYQARRYLRFANRVFLVLDGAFSNRVYSYHNKILLYNIGLGILKKSDGEVNIYSLPNWHLPFSHSEHVLIGERLWSTVYENKYKLNFGYFHSKV